MAPSSEPSASVNHDVEAVLRRIGVEGEDAFYLVAYQYATRAGRPSDELPVRVLRRGQEVCRRIGEDSELADLLESVCGSDPIGERLPNIYQHFLGRRFREGSGKFFTPQPVAEAMASLLPVRPDAAIMDPTCGGGTFLIEASKRWGDTPCRLVGNDVEPSLADLTELMLVLATDTGHDRCVLCSNIYQPDDELRGWEGAVDFILANPPFSLKITSIDIASPLFDLGYANSDALFLDTARELLRPGGRLVSLLPHSIVGNADFEKLRTAIEDRWYLRAVVGLPEGVFHLTANTSTRADIVVLDKRSDVDESVETVFAFAPSVGVPLNGRRRDANGNSLSTIVSDSAVRAALGVEAR